MTQKMRRNVRQNMACFFLAGFFEKKPANLKKKPAKKKPAQVEPAFFT